MSVNETTRLYVLLGIAPDRQPPRDHRRPVQVYQRPGGVHPRARDHKQTLELGR
jgi:hypothetical protein